jgi:hypothetical protein
LHNPFFNKLSELYGRSGTGHTFTQATVKHHEKQKELRKRHYTLLTQTLARSRQHALQGNISGIHDSYKDYVKNSVDLMKQSMTHYVDYTQNQNHSKKYASATRQTFENIVNKAKNIKPSFKPNLKKGNIAATMASIGSLLASPVAAKAQPTYSKTQVSSSTSKTGTTSQSKTSQKATPQKKTSKSVAGSAKKISATTKKVGVGVKKTTATKVVNSSSKTTQGAKVTPISKAKKVSSSKARVTPIKTKSVASAKSFSTNGAKVSLTSAKSTKSKKSTTGVKTGVKKISFSKTPKVTKLSSKSSSNQKISGRSNVGSQRA